MTCSARAFREAPYPGPGLDHAAAEEEHDDDERYAKEQRPARPHDAHRLREPDEYHRADDRAIERAAAADQGGEHDVAGEDEADRFQRHDAEEHRVEHAGEAGEGAAEHEREPLE